jgi:hypothetical protein
MADPFFNQDFHFGSWIGHSISRPQFLIPEAQFFLREPSFAAAKRQIPPTGKIENRKLLLFINQQCRRFRLL